MIDIVDPRTGELLDTDSVPGLAQVAGLHSEQLRQLQSEIQGLREPTLDDSGPTAFAWNSLGAHQAETLWLQLAEWVGWLRGRYPLARQVPACWWRHPELVEELTALWLAWREAYVEKSAPLTAAADWHDRWLPGFLRRIGAGGWNLACEGEHKDRLPSLYDERPVDDEDAFGAHVRRDVSRRRAALFKTATSEEDAVDQMSDAQMQEALTNGEAVQVGSMPGAPVRIGDVYWAPSDDGWTRVENAGTLQFLADAERRLQLADRAIISAGSSGGRR